MVDFTELCLAFLLSNPHRTLFQTAFARPLLPQNFYLHNLRRREQQCHGTKSQRHMAPGQEDALEAYPYPTPCDGILSNLDTDQYNPRMIAADGIEIHAFRRPCQRHNTLFLQDKDVPVQWVVAAPCSPRSFESQRDCGTWPQAEAACSTVPNTPRCTLMSAPCSSSCCTIWSWP